jgi:hypothetical protein
MFVSTLLHLEYFVNIKAKQKEVVFKVYHQNTSPIPIIFYMLKHILKSTVRATALPFLFIILHEK